MPTSTPHQVVPVLVVVAQTLLYVLHDGGVGDLVDMRRAVFFVCTSYVQLKFPYLGKNTPTFFHIYLGKNTLTFFHILEKIPQLFSVSE